MVLWILMGESQVNYMAEIRANGIVIWNNKFVLVRKTTGEIDYSEMSSEGNNITRTSRVLGNNLR